RHDRRGAERTAEGGVRSLRRDDGRGMGGERRRGRQGDHRRLPGAVEALMGADPRPTRQVIGTGTAGDLRRALGGLYNASGALAAVCLVLILLVIVLQMIARWTGIPFHGSSEYAGYLMASASFLAFAHTLNRGAHIRVSLLLAAAGERRYWLE